MESCMDSIHHPCLFRPRWTLFQLCLVLPPIDLIWWTLSQSRYCNGILFQSLYRFGFEYAHVSVLFLRKLVVCLSTEYFVSWAWSNVCTDHINSLNIVWEYMFWQVWVENTVFGTLTDWHLWFVVNRSQSPLDNPHCLWRCVFFWLPMLNVRRDLRRSIHLEGFIHWVKPSWFCQVECRYQDDKAVHLFISRIHVFRFGRS